MIRVEDPQTYTDPIVISCASQQAVDADPCDGQNATEGSAEGSGE